MTDKTIFGTPLRDLENLYVEFLKGLYFDQHEAFVMWSIDNGKWKFYTDMNGKEEFTFTDFNHQTEFKEWKMKYNPFQVSKFAYEYAIGFKPEMFIMEDCSNRFCKNYVELGQRHFHFIWLEWVEINHQIGYTYPPDREKLEQVVPYDKELDRALQDSINKMREAGSQMKFDTRSSGHTIWVSLPDDKSIEMPIGYDVYNEGDEIRKTLCSLNIVVSPTFDTELEFYACTREGKVYWYEFVEDSPMYPAMASLYGEEALLKMAENIFNKKSDEK